MLTTPRAQITADNVGQLTDEQVLLLLEEHARRVVEEDGSELKLPVKVSFIPIIQRKMQHRAQIGALHGTLAAEAGYLENWIRTKVVSHHTPTAQHIENKLRTAYRQLKPSSTPIIQGSGSLDDGRG